MNKKHPYWQRGAAATRLSKLIAGRDRYKAWADRKCLSVSGDEWAQWCAWRRARQDKYAAEIAAAVIEKRFNQRSKANGRKRDTICLTRRGT